MNSVFSPVQQFLITWLLVLVTGWFTLTAVSYVGELVSILVTAGLIAFLLNYAVARLQVFLPRGVAAGLVYLTAGVVVVVIGLTIVPPVFNQASQLGVRLPELLESGRLQLGEFQAWSAERNLPFDVQILEQQLSARVQGQVQAIAGTGLGLVVGTFNWFLDLIFIVGDFLLYAPRRAKSVAGFDQHFFPRNSLCFNRDFAAKPPAICIGTVIAGTIYGHLANSGFLVAASSVFSVVCRLYRIDGNNSVYWSNFGNWHC
jgi:predicted PurR-regulated permease PerM